MVYRRQSHIFLSPTEAGNIVIPMFLQDVLRIMLLLDKIRERKLQATCMTLAACGTVEEDNLGFLELNCPPTLQSPTKHTNAPDHYFRKHGCSRKVQTFLPPNQFDVIDDNGCLGCGLIHPAVLAQLLGNSQLAQRVFAIQVRKIGPSSVNIAEGMLFVQEDMKERKIQLPTSMTFTRGIKDQTADTLTKALP